MPPLLRILETVLYVDDLDRGTDFYQGIMGLPVIHADDRMRTFDVAGSGTLLLFRHGATTQPVILPGGSIPPHDGHGAQHIAFAITAEDLDAWRDHLLQNGIAIEAATDWPRGGHSLYFRDPDDHLLELATPGLWPGY